MGTVCIALLGMFVLQTEFLNGVAVASALTVALTVLAAVTLLPALLGLLGMRVLGRMGAAQAGSRMSHCPRTPHPAPGSAGPLWSSGAPVCCPWSRWW